MHIEGSTSSGLLGPVEHMCTTVCLMHLSGLAKCTLVEEKKKKPFVKLIPP